MGSNGVPTLLAANLDTLSIGTMSAASFLSATGMTYAQAGATTQGTGHVGASYQTSASTLAFIGTTADLAQIGDAGYGRGLVIQPRNRNLLPILSAQYDTRNQNSAGWVPVISGTYPSGTNGPDGTNSNIRVQCPSGSPGSYAQLNSTVNGRYNCASVWVRSTPSSSMPIAVTVSKATAGTNAVFTSAANATWQRVTLNQATVIGDGNTMYIVPVDGTNEVASGGLAAGTRDQLMDCCQLDGNDFASEYLDGYNCIREPDSLSWPAGFIDADGSISFYLKYIAKHGTTNLPYSDATSVGGQSVQLYQYLFSYTGTHGEYARINVGTGTAWRLEMGNTLDFGGVGQVSSSSISFNRGDIVEVFIKMGGGAATVAKWRVGGSGSWNLWGLTSTFSVVTTGSHPLCVGNKTLGSGTTLDGSIWGWIQKSYIYKSGQRPSGA